MSQPQEAYEANLDFVAQAFAYNRYIVDAVAPYLGQRVLDVGCGIGNTTALIDRPLVVGLELSDRFLGRFRQRLPGVPVLQGDIAHPDVVTQLSGFAFDTIFSSNVIEHVEDDASAFVHMHRILAPGGRIAILVPAYSFLYGSMDAEDLHFRRYGRSELRAKMEAAGFTVERLFHLNFPGIFWWWLNGRVLKRRCGSEGEAGLVNAVMPAVRVIDKLLFHSAGLSLIGIARR